MYKILVIASGKDIDVPQEIQNLQLINGLDVDIIAGKDATLQRISFYASQTIYFGIYIVCHSDGQRFYLANDVFITREYIAKICKLADVTLFYANACQTIYFGQYLVDNGVPVAITNSIQPEFGIKDRLAIYDHDALVNGLMFFRQLVKLDGDVEAAHKATKNDDGALSIHSNGGLAKRLMEPVLMELKCFKIWGAAVAATYGVFGVFIMLVLWQMIRSS